MTARSGRCLSRTRARVGRLALVTLLAMGAAPEARGQAPQGDSARGSVALLQRARQLQASGREADARRLIDSVLAVTPMNEALYADALYWRAANAPTASDAERDYRRLLIESPLSQRAAEAMLRLADLQQARGDRRGATDDLQRFMLTYANHPERPRVAVALVRLLFDLGPQFYARACEAVRTARDEIPAGNAELRNQLEYYEPRCAYPTASAPPGGDSATRVPAPDTAARRPVPAPSATAPATTAPPTAAPSAAAPPPARPTPAAPRATAAFYSVQVAAYDSREPAERLARLLVSRGVEARVDGTERPFRVRVGRYTTRADAVKSSASLKAQGYNGFITLVNPR